MRGGDRAPLLSPRGGRQPSRDWGWPRLPQRHTSLALPSDPWSPQLSAPPGAALHCWDGGFFPAARRPEPGGLEGGGGRSHSEDPPSLNPSNPVWARAACQCAVVLPRGFSQAAPGRRTGQRASPTERVLRSVREQRGPSPTEKGHVFRGLRKICGKEITSPKPHQREDFSACEESGFILTLAGDSAKFGGRRHPVVRTRLGLAAASAGRGRTASGRHPGPAPGRHENTRGVLHRQSTREVTGVAAAPAGPGRCRGQEPTPQGPGEPGPGARPAGEVSGLQPPQGPLGARPRSWVTVLSSPLGCRHRRVTGGQVLALA